MLFKLALSTQLTQHLHTGIIHFPPIRVNYYLHVIFREAEVKLYMFAIYIFIMTVISSYRPSFHDLTETRASQ